jgi:osmoprotectant transport system permease protein
MGTGMKPAVTALTILAIPPILLNTTLAFQTLPEPVLETALGMGMGKWRTFFSVKLPLAFPLIFTGIKTAAVEVIASATLAAYIGAGGLGSLIFTGLGLMRTDLLIIGAASVGGLSLASGYLLNKLDRRITRYKKVGI